MIFKYDVNDYKHSFTPEELKIYGIVLGEVERHFFEQRVITGMKIHNKSFSKSTEKNTFAQSDMERAARIIETPSIYSGIQYTEPQYMVFDMK